MPKSFAPLVEWEITRSCDLYCAHCYNRPNKKRRGELDTQDALGLARQLACNGCKSVTLSGGEPLKRDDWPHLAQALTRRGVEVQVVTNGQRLGRREVSLLKETGVHMVFLSLDGLGKTHDRIRHRRGAFHRVLQGLSALQAAGIQVAVNTTILRNNVADLPGLARLVNERSIPLWTVWLGIPTHNRKGALWLQEDRLPALAKRISRLRASCPALSLGDNLRFLLPRGTRPLNPELENHPTPVDLGCPAGVHTLNLRSDGTVSLCPALQEKGVVGDLTKQPISMVWEKVKLKKARLCREAVSARRRRDHLLSALPCHATRSAYVHLPTRPALAPLRKKTACLVVATGLAAAPLACSGPGGPGGSDPGKTTPQPSSAGHQEASPPAVQDDESSSHPPKPREAGREPTKKKRLGGGGLQAGAPKKKPPGKKTCVHSGNGESTQALPQLLHDACLEAWLCVRRLRPNQSSPRRRQDALTRSARSSPPRSSTPSSPRRKKNTAPGWGSTSANASSRWTMKLRSSPC